MMKKFKLRLFCLLLIPFSLLFHYLFSLFPHIGETFYSLKFNKVFIQYLSQLTGVFPFSIFEVSIYFMLLFCVIYLIYLCCSILKYPKHWYKTLANFTLNSLALFSVVYFLFMSMWGFNYLRPHFGQTIGVELTTHSNKELAELYAYLVEKTNSLAESVVRNAEGYMIIPNGYLSVFERSHLGYTEASKTFPILSGYYGNPKPILSSKAMNYTGISGIYSPFTAEANVNIAVLDLSIPATTMHEMAHQRGYANEDEANFIAFLTCKFHPDVDFQYSGYLLALTHTASALAKDNPSLLHELNQNLSSYVINDIRHNYNFWQQYSGKVESISSQMNNIYLQMNGVSDGTKSYGRMVDLLLGYHTIYLK